jgi:hypothetical protein
MQELRSCLLYEIWPLHVESRGRVDFSPALYPESAGLNYRPENRDFYGFPQSLLSVG